MDKNIIKTVIGSLHKEINETQLINRPMTFEENVCYVLVGIRRAGKSYLMIQDIKQRIENGKMTLEDCLYINFEDELFPTSYILNFVQINPRFLVSEHLLIAVY